MITVTIKKSVKTNGEWGLFISFPYKKEIVDSIRAMPLRYWHAETMEWEVPFNKLQAVLSAFSTKDIRIVADDAKAFLKRTTTLPTSFQFKTKPFDHQVEGLEYGLKYDKWLLGDEQGLGKTKQVIDIAVAKKLQNGYKHCLIICGVNGLKWNWQNEIAVHSNETGYILGQRVAKRSGKIKIGSNQDKLYDLDHLEDVSSYFIITNVESLRDDKIASKIAKLCASNQINMIAADEIHRMKNPSSQQGKGFLKLHTGAMIAMTGTPLMNTPLDLYIILKWLGYESHAFYSFKQHYCTMGGFGGHEVLGYKHLDELQARLDEIMLRRLKADVLDLPEKLYVDEYVEMTPKQSQVYKEVTMAIQANIDQVKTSANPLAELIRLRQATGFTGILSSSIQESAKLDRLEELVEDAVSNNDKVVIFSNWTQMTDAIYQRLISNGNPYKPAIITGETSDESRQDEVEHFQTDDRCKVIIGTIGAMGTGLTLTAGTTVIFVDHPWTRASYDQAVDRCHRIGQNNNITIYNLLCKDTIDERIWTIVKNKGEMSDAIVDGKTLNNKSDLVDYLLG